MNAMVGQEAATGAERGRLEREDDALGLASLPAPLRIVAIGGGTGLPGVLHGLSAYADRLGGLPPIDLTAVVAVSDDGGSSGRLRRDQGIPAPGDIRNCLVAMARGQSLAHLFQYRFRQGKELGGHSLGNLVLAAMMRMEGDLLAAIRRAEAMLECSGRVLPVTLEPVQLLGLLSDGSWLVGEHAFGRKSRAPLRRVELTPRAPLASPGVLEAIRQADVVILGPGSLYSSVIANLVVSGVADALDACGGLRIYIQNLLCQRGETEGLDAAGHLEAIRRHAGDVIDVVLFDTGITKRRLPARTGSPVRWDRKSLLAQGVLPMEADLLCARGGLRHDPRKTALAVLALALEAGEV